MTYKILTELRYLMTNIIRRLPPITSGRSISSFHSISFPNVEPIEDYRSGGFHPVHLHGIYAERYRVLHKLGHGGFSTVWLTRDELLQRPISLNILKSEVSTTCTELESLESLRRCTVQHPGRKHAMSILDHFKIEEPNGTHACLVSQVAGPSVTQM